MLYAGQRSKTTTEEYETELERMNVAMTADNQQLQHDNKQLGALLKEFEQTLEQIMSTFRTQAVSQKTSHTDISHAHHL
jgi:uncharacterized protein involved in exopolysaccharide biosynthesis